MRTRLATIALTASLAGLVACDAAPTAPAAPAAPAPPAIVIEILGVRGEQSFSPSPLTAMAGQTVVWHNADTMTHHVVLNDGELDTGPIAAGASSAPMVLVEPSSYHCSIHPSMIGTIAE